MKILIENSTNIIKYCEKDFIQYKNMTLILNSGEVKEIVSDMNIDNSTVESVTSTSIPKDFEIGKYKYENGSFVKIIEVVDEAIITE